MSNHPRKQRTTTLGLVLLAAGALTAVSCGDDAIVGPTEGALLVGARTTGSDFDVNGYLVSVNSGQGQQIGHQDTIYVTALEPGDYAVNLTGIADNCSVPEDDNPQTADVVAGDTTEVLFDITCDPMGPPGGGGGGDLLRTGTGR